jgi:hypothetical protein
MDETPLSTIFKEAQAMRYQFYREHKYVSAALNDVERKIARTDFMNPIEIQEAYYAFQGLSEMLKAHAHYENEKLHSLLEKKHSHVHKHAEQDHAHQDEQLEEIVQLFEQVKQAGSEEEKVALGYQLYLTYRKFVADNLHHLHEEETLILPELQRLYSDAELKQVEAVTYRMMTPDQLVEMLQVLFPHMNPSDQKAFLTDIQDAQPNHFAEVWKAIGSI